MKKTVKVCVSLPVEYVKALDRLVEAKLYITRYEAIKDAVRNLIREAENNIISDRGD